VLEVRRDLVEQLQCSLMLALLSQHRGHANRLPPASLGVGSERSGPGPFEEVVEEIRRHADLIGRVSPDLEAQ
jgi:hypothetical protein